MSNDCIVISSDNESEFQHEDVVQKVEKKPYQRCEEEVLYISSSEDDQAFFFPKMKSDPEELPEIRFELREARRYRHRHKSRKSSNENKHKADGAEVRQGKLAGLVKTEDTLYMPNDEAPRIPPLPDLSLFCSDTKTEDSNSQPMPDKFISKEKKPVTARKKRQSIEAIKTKEREILGDLFAVDRESSDSDCFITGTRNKYGKVLKNISEKKSKDAKRNLQLKNNNHLDENVRNEKARPSKNISNRDPYAKDEHFESDKSQNSQDGSKSRNSSGTSQDGKNYLKEKQCKKLNRNTAGDIDSFCSVKKELQCLSVQIPKSKNDKKMISGLNKKPHPSIHNFERIAPDKSDTCHQIGSRVGPFDILTSLGKSYENEWENLKISPRIRETVKINMIPLVKIHTSTSMPLLNQKSESPSVNGSESESDNEKTKRHFLDVFVSDISEAETDDGVDKLDVINKGFDEFGNTTVTLNKSFYDKVSIIAENDETLTIQSCDMDYDVNKENDGVALNQNISQGDVMLPAEINQNLNPLPLNETSSLTNCNEVSVIPFKSLNYQVKSEEFSDISEDDENQNQAVDVIAGTNTSMSEIDEVDALVNSPVYRNDYLGISTITVSESDESVIHISSDKIIEMPILEKVPSDKYSAQNFEMPILEKYSEVYSCFRNELEDQEMLPDISDDEEDVEVIEMPFSMPLEIKEPSPKHIVEHSSQCSKTSNSSHNIFTKFSLTQAKSAVSSSSESKMSKSTAATFSLKSSISEIALSSPKDCSTAKSRKRKIIRKSNTCSSFGSSELYSSSIPTISSHYKQLSLTRQIDQLTIYMNDFLCLNDSKTVLPKIPETRINIVYGCEEDGLLNLGHALNFVEHFCRKYIIPNGLCNDIIKAAFYSECKLSHIHWAYNLLSELNTRRGAEIEMNWEMIDRCLKVALSASKGKQYYQLLQPILLLQLGVDVLKMDLYTRELSDNRQIRKTFAYNMFAYDVSTGNRKALMYYLNQALHAGQCRTGTNGETFQLPDVLPMLQDLFALCVDVSSSCLDCANMLAADMVNTYKFLPNLADKQLLIKSVSSHLLQCKLVQQVLESQYDCTQTLGGAFPDCLEDIIQCFFKVMPLKNPLTPPTTPNEDLLWEEEGHFNRFAAEVTEEIAILLYFVVVSYLQASNDKLYVPLRLRVNLSERKKKLRTEDVEELGKMQEHVQELENHLRGMTPDLTENTEHYLFLMSCLGDLGRVQRE